MEANMKYVYQLYLDRSFSKAAEHLYMTQPALSIAIKRVEAELGAELFDRSRHPLELTQAGEAYIATIRQIRHLEEELQREAWEALMDTDIIDGPLTLELEKIREQSMNIL